MLPAPYLSSGEVLRAILAHVSNVCGGEGVMLQLAVLFLDEHPELDALDAVMLFSGDESVSSTWLNFRQMSAGLRRSILEQVRADLSTAPADSFIPHEYIPILVMRAA